MIWNEAEEKRSPVEGAFRWFWHQPEVTVVLSGMNDEEHIPVLNSTTINISMEMQPLQRFFYASKRNPGRQTALSSLTMPGLRQMRKELPAKTANSRTNEKHSS